MKERNIEFRPGDILFIRVGFVKAYNQLPANELPDFFIKANANFMGLEATLDSLRWLWDNQFAAVASDSPAFERGPINAAFNDPDINIHQWCLAGWGLPIGELFDLEKLAEECRRLGRWSFFVSSVPLKVSPLGDKPQGIQVDSNRCQGASLVHQMLWRSSNSTEGS